MMLQASTGDWSTVLLLAVLAPFRLFLLGLALFSITIVWQFSQHLSPVFSCYQQASANMWTVLFQMSLENAKSSWDHPKCGIKDAHALMNTNEDVAFKSLRKKAHFSSLVSWSTDFFVPESPFSAIDSSWHLSWWSNQCLYMLEAVVMETPEDVPESSLRSWLDNLASYFLVSTGQLTTSQSSKDLSF